MDWSLDPVFGSFTLVALAAVGLLFVAFAIRETAVLSRGQRFVLWSLRIVLCLLLLLLLLRPGITFTKQSSPRGSVAVMMDTSSSMQLASGDGQKTRWESQLEVWNAIWNARSQLGKDTTIVPFLYDSKLHPLGEFETTDSKSAPVLPQKAEGMTTEIGGPLQQVASASLKSPLTAVIWMGDGTQTQTPIVTDPQQVARQLARLDIPMYLIGFGPRSDNDNSRDLAIEGVAEQLDAFSKSQLQIRGFVRCRGVANRDVAVTLMMVQKSGLPKAIERTIVRPTKPDQLVAFQIPLTAPDAGSYELIVKAEPVDGEVSELNNQANVYLNVRTGGIRILYLEGDTRYEFKFIKGTVSESKDIQLETRIIEEAPLEKWPVDLSQLLSNRVFDCLILGDVDFDAIGRDGAKLIADQVGLGMGLVTLGGYHSYTAGGWDRSPLADVMPIVMSPGRRQGIGRDIPIELRNHFPGALKLRPRTADKLLQIGEPGSDLVKTWSEMKPLLGANRWDGPKNLPGVQVLAESEEGFPLIVTGTYERGRVVSLAFDSSYVWLRQGKRQEHKQFWRQILMWCLRRETVEEGMQLAMSQRRLFLQQQTELTLNWNGGTSNSEMPKTVLLHLWKLGDPTRNGPDGEDRNLGEHTLQRNDAASMRLAYTSPKESGRYEWRAKAVGTKGQDIVAKLPFIVIDQSIESLQPIPDWSLLNQLAKLNASAGGEVIVPEQTDDVIRRILERQRQATETAVENRKLGEGTIDTWTAFALIATVMITQWSLRKKWNLP